jgi:hypothetical protein
MKPRIKGVMKDFRLDSPDLFHPLNNKNLFNKKRLEFKYFHNMKKASVEDAYMGMMFTYTCMGITALMFYTKRYLEGTESELTENSWNHHAYKSMGSNIQKSDPYVHFNASNGRYTGDPMFLMRPMPKHPEAFKDGLEGYKKASYTHNKHNPEFFNQKIEYRKD